MRVLSLFSGIGGLDLGLRGAVPTAHTVAYCERNPYCVEVLKARMADGRLDTAPVYDDVRRDWTDLAGHVDAVVGGFPCQDTSTAGDRAGIVAGNRSGLFFELARAIRDSGARFCFLENVAAIVVRGLDIVLGELDAIGFDAEWGCLRASDVGAQHQRDRWFCFAWRSVPYSDGARLPRPEQDNGLPVGERAAHAVRGHGTIVERLALDGDRRGLRSPDGVSVTMERKRLAALGNSCVPAQAAEAFRLLIQRSGVTP